MFFQRGKIQKICLKIEVTLFKNISTACCRVVVVYVETLGLLALIFGMFSTFIIVFSFVSISQLGRCLS